MLCIKLASRGYILFKCGKKTRIYLISCMEGVCVAASTAAAVTAVFIAPLRCELPLNNYIFPGHWKGQGRGEAGGGEAANGICPTSPALLRGVVLFCLLYLP